jgi:hypothetical protein
MATGRLEMLKSILLATCVVLYPIAGSADALQALGQLGPAFEKLVEFIVMRHDAMTLQSVPKVVTAFILLSSEKDNLAELLEEASNGNSPQSTAEIEHQIEVSSRIIVNSVRDLEGLIKSIDPQWVISHPELLRAADDLRLEKVRFINKNLVGYANGQHEVRLDPVQMMTLAAALHTEANKLLEEGKTLAKVTARS